MRSFLDVFSEITRRFRAIPVPRARIPTPPPVGVSLLVDDIVSGQLALIRSDGSTVKYSASSGGGGGSSDHATLTNRVWTSSAHTGTASRLASFDGSGAAAYTQIGAAGGVQAWDADLDGYAALASPGLVARTGAGTAAARTLTAGSGQVTVTNGDGVAGNPTVDLAYAGALRETGGPTTLTVGAMADGEILIRSGSSLVTLAAPASGDRQGRVLGYAGTALAWIAMPLVSVLGRGDIVIEGRGIVNVPDCVTVGVL
jgi:hypothetical protein